MTPRYVELAAVTNFSFLHGASHPEEMAVTAARKWRLVKAAKALRQRLRRSDGGGYGGDCRRHSGGNDGRCRRRRR